MSEPYRTWCQTTLWDVPSTPSPGSEDGHSHSDSLEYWTRCRSGPGAVPVSRSASLDDTVDRPTSATSGRCGTNSSASASLQSSLESRLRALLVGRGSTLFRLTWRHWDTPSGRPICALRASVPRTSDSDSTSRLACQVLVSWPTPRIGNGGTDSPSRAMNPRGRL